MKYNNTIYILQKEIEKIDKRLALKIVQEYPHAFLDAIKEKCELKMAIKKLSTRINKYQHTNCN